MGIVKIDFDINSSQLRNATKDVANLGREIKDIDTKIDIQVAVDSKKPVSEFRKIESSGTKMSENIGKVAKVGMAAAAVGAAAVAAAVGVAVKEMFGFNNELENTVRRLTAVTGDADTAATALDNLTKVANTTGQGVNETVEAYSKLAVRGIRPTQDELVSLVAVAQTSGKSLDDLSEAILDAQQGEKERLKEFGISMTETSEGVQLSMGNTVVSAENVTDAFVTLAKESPEIAKSMELMGTTTSDSIQRAKNSMFELARSFVEGVGASTIFSGAISYLNSVLDYAKNNVDNFISGLQAAGKSIAKVFAPTIQIFSKIGERIQSASNSILTFVKSSTAARAATAVFDTIQSIVTILARVFSDLVVAIADVVARLTRMLAPAITIITSNFGFVFDIASRVVSIFLKLVSVFTRIGAIIYDYFQPAIDFMVAGFVNFVNMMKDFVLPVFDTIISALDSLLAALGQSAQKAASTKIEVEPPVQKDCPSGTIWNDIEGRCIPESKKEAQSGGGGGGSGAAVKKEEPTLADTEAEKRLAEQLQKRQQELERAYAKEEISKEQFDVNMRELEIQHIAEVEELAEELYTTMPEKYRNRNEDEEREFRLKLNDIRFQSEMSFLELMKKLREDEIADETARYDAMLAAAERAGQEQLNIQDYYARLTEQDTMTAAVAASKIEIEKYDNLIAIQEEKEAYLLEQGVEFDSQIQELEDAKNAALIDKEIALNDKLREIKDIRQERERAAMEKSTQNVDELFSQIAGTEINIASTFFGSVEDFQANSERLRNLKNQLNELELAGEGSSEAAAALRGEIDSISPENLANITATVGQVAMDIVSAVNSMQQQAYEENIKRIEGEIEMQEKLIEAKKEALDEEKDILDERREFEDAITEQRNEELEYLKTQLPEAEAEKVAQLQAIEAAETAENRRLEDEDIARKEQLLAREEQKKAQMEKKVLEQKSKAFEAQKAADIANIIISSAVAFAQTLATVPFPASLIVAPLIAGLAAAQIVQVANQKNPYKGAQALAEGTLSVEGGTEGKDSVPAILMPGEAVIPTKMARKYRPILEHIYHDSLNVNHLGGVTVERVTDNNLVREVDNLNKKIDKLAKVIKNQAVNVELNEKGFSVFSEKIINNNNKKNELLYEK